MTRHQFDAASGPCLEITNAPGATKYDVMLSGHMDTVFPVKTAVPCAWKTPPAYGPGVSDMKGGVLAMLYALRGLDPAVLARLKVVVCLNCDEEIGSPSSRDWLVATARKSRCVLVCEAARANGDLVKARKGNAKYRLAFHGKAAHAGTSLRDGISAITELAHWTLAINDLVNFLPPAPR